MTAERLIIIIELAMKAKMLNNNVRMHQMEHSAYYMYYEVYSKTTPPE
jgi:hypothetical protein